MKMQRYCVILSLMLVVTILSANTIPVQASNGDGLVFEEIRRDVTVSTFGAVSVDDRFTVLNNGSAPISETLVYYPTKYLDILTSREALDSSEAKILLTVDEASTIQHFTAYSVVFSSPIQPGERDEFIIRSSYHDFFVLIDDRSDYQETSLQEFESYYYWVPLVNTTVQSIRSRFITRSNTVFYNVPENATFITEQDR